MDDITLTPEEQRRSLVLARLLASDLGIEEAAALLGLSVRQAWRLKARFHEQGAAGLVHGNRDRPSPRRVDDAIRERVIALARDPLLRGISDSHLTDLLHDHGIVLSRPTVRRILRGASIASPFPHRPPTHRSRRERMPREGMMLQLDGSRHDWLEGRGPWLTLTGAIDDATSALVSATFRDEEDSAGYLWLLADIASRLGLPLAVYRDRHAAFETHEARLPVPELRSGDARRLTQVGRALDVLGISSIAAGSPQAKGRVERGWGTSQGRLPIELRIAGASDRESANRVLAEFIPRYNARFAVPAADPEPAWRPVPADIDLRAVCAFRYERVIANDATVRIGGLVLDIPRQPGGRSLAGRRVEVRMELDGRLVITDGPRELLSTRVTVDTGRLRDLERARFSLGRSSPAPAPGYPPTASHPWRRATPGSALETSRQQERQSARDRVTDQED